MNNLIANLYEEENDIFALPQTYKNINFHPIKVKQVKLKELMYKLFAVPKNYIPEKSILKMSYIKFLFYVVQNNYKESGSDLDLQESLIYFLKEITKANKITYKYDNIDKIKSFDDILESLRINIVIDNVSFDEQEFENIRAIILEQNGSSAEYIEEYFPDLEEKLVFLNRQYVDLDLKDEIYIFSCLTGLSEEQIGEKTLYQFKNRLEREVLLKDYELFKPLEVSGQISSKNGDEIFKHYFSHIAKLRRYHNLMLEKNKFFEDSGLANIDGDGNIRV